MLKRFATTLLFLLLASFFGIAQSPATNAALLNSSTSKDTHGNGIRAAESRHVSGAGGRSAKDAARRKRRIHQSWL